MISHKSTGVATAGRERPAGDEGDAVTDRVHASKSQTGTRGQSGDRRAMGAQDEDQGQQRRARQGTGEEESMLSPNDQLTLLMRLLCHFVFRFYPLVLPCL